MKKTCLSVEELPTILHDLTERLAKIENTLTQSVKNERKTIGPEEAAKILRLSRSRVYVLCMEGKLPAHKVGGRLLFYTDDLEKFIRRGSRMKQEALPIKKTDAL